MPKQIKSIPLLPARVVRWLGVALIFTCGWSVLVAGTVPGKTPSMESPRLRSGQVTLTKKDLRSGILELRGEAFFIPGRLIQKPGEFWREWKEHGSAGDFPFLNLGRAWNGYEYRDAKTRQRAEMDGAGRGTYGFIIRAEPELIGQTLRIRFQHVSSSGALILEGGNKTVRAGQIFGELTPAFEPLEVEFTARAQNRFLLLVRNEVHARGGAWRPAQLAYPRVFENRRQFQRVLDSLILGGILAMALYHLAVYWLQRQERQSLWLALLAVAIPLRIMLTEQYMIELLPGFFHWSVLLRLEYLSFYGSAWLVFHFVRKVARLPWPPAVGLWVERFILLMTASVLVLPTAWYTKTLFSFQVFSLALVLVFAYAFWQNAWRGRDIRALILMIGFMVMGITVTVDVTQALLSHYNAATIHIGLFFFIFSQGLTIAVTNSRARRTAEYLSRNLKEEVENNTKEIRERQRIMDRELKLARKVQQRILPVLPQVHGGAEIHGLFQPAAEIGGDIFDLIVLPRDMQIWLFVADVKGHGVPAALISVAVKNSFLHNCSEDKEPSRVLSDVNYELCEFLAQDDFFTAFLIKIDLREGSVTYAGGGGQYSLLLTGEPDKPRFEKLDGGGPLLGVWPESQFPAGEKLTIHPGGWIFLFTDGLLEQQNDSGEAMGREGLEQALKEVINKRRAGKTDALEMREADFMTPVKKAFDDFRGRQAQKDDITCLGVYFNPQRLIRRG